MQVFFAGFLQVILQVFYRLSFVFTEHVTLRVYESLQSTGFLRDRGSGRASASTAFPEIMISCAE
jgi:hypothetical protein